MKKRNRTYEVIVCILLLCTFAVCFAINGSNGCAPINLSDSSYLKQFVYYNINILYSDSLPFSFSYGGQSSASLLSGIKPTIRKYKITDNIETVEKEWRCKDGLIVTLSAKSYFDYSAIEWLVYISFNGKRESKIISNLYSIDLLFPINEDNSIIIHSNKGDDCTKYSYQPYKIVLNRNQSEIFSPTEENRPSGRSSTGPRGWPYWNIQNGTHGWILAVGWPGTWQNIIDYENDSSFRVRAGQKIFKAVLRSGETIRTPLICVLPWKTTDVETSQNIWRRFYLNHIIPKYNNKPEEPALEIQAYMDEAEKSRVQKYLDLGIKPRILWKDAGWYPTNNGKWDETGEWKVDVKKYPNGIKPFIQWAKSQGFDCLLWFEPERVKGNNTLTTHHQDWLLSESHLWSQILNLGDSNCLNWLINHIDSLITENCIDWYREDMNENPYRAWIQADRKQGTDRLGITENLYVQGHLVLWDTLKQRNPNLHIDACASGGRRNDLETMHRAVPLLRSDYQWRSLGEDYIIGNQAHTWALSSWLPYQGQAVYEHEPYKFRSFYLPCFGIGGLNEKTSAAIKQGYSECEQLQAMMLYGDYWPLTPYSLESDEWIAWQFNRPEDGDGCIQAFRREKCKDDYIKIKLRGLEKKVFYLIKNFDSYQKTKVSGEVLMKRGLKVMIDEKPGSAIFVYEKIKK